MTFDLGYAIVTTVVGLYAIISVFINHNNRWPYDALYTFSSKLILVLMPLFIAFSWLSIYVL